MGNNSSIEIKEKPNGIFQVIAKDIENYPISYLRLCWDFDEKKYCIAQSCDTESKETLHRKLLVVGMNLPDMDKIHEQCFYLSSGSNSVETLNKFFKKNIITDDKTGGIDLWLPFMGFGYDVDVVNYENYQNEYIKFLKTGFGCSKRGPRCLFGRFGQFEPNLMQISYCLGGKFWENNFEMIKSEFEIQELPNINYFLESKIPCIFNYKKWTNEECSIYLNKYIASALHYNYSPYLLSFKNRNLKYFKKEKEFDWSDVKVDYRILYILKEKKIIKFSTINGLANLPFELTFTDDYWTIYITNLYRLYTTEKKYFIENIVPLINEIIPIIPQIKLKVEKEDLSYVIKKEEIITGLGTKENPYDKREQTKIGEYFLRGGKPLQRKK